MRTWQILAESTIPESQTSAPKPRAALKSPWFQVNTLGMWLSFLLIYPSSKSPTCNIYNLFTELVLGSHYNFLSQWTSLRLKISNGFMLPQTHLESKILNFSWLLLSQIPNNSNCNWDYNYMGKMGKSGHLFNGTTLNVKGQTVNLPVESYHHIPYRVTLARK